MHEAHFLRKYISDDDINQVVSSAQQNRDVLHLDDILDLLCKNIIIFKFSQRDIKKCPFCGCIRVGTNDLARHIKLKHSVEGIYYESIQVIPHKIDNIDPLNPPSVMYLCFYCWFPTSNAFGSNPTSVMSWHINNDCKKVTDPKKSLKLSITEDPVFIKNYLSMKKGIDAKRCREGDAIFEQEELAITHYIEMHCKLEVCDIETIKRIHNNPADYLSDSLDIFNNLIKENNESIAFNKISLLSYVREWFSGRDDFVSFSNSWLLCSKLLSVNINKVAEELTKYPNGLTTEKLVYLIFGNNQSIDQFSTQRFSLCYLLQQSGNFIYDFEQGIWKFKPAIIEDSPPEEDEVLSSMRSPIRRILSKIKLKEEPYFPLTEYNGKEIDMATWKRIKKDEISYLLFFTYIYNGFLPYDKKAKRLFPPNVRRIYFITDSGEKFTVKIDKNRRAVYSRYLKKFFQDIPAGTIVYLRRLNSDRAYKIYFKKTPQTIKDCRMVKYDPIKKAIFYEIKDLDVLYECHPPVFKVELRFKDLEALWKEAELSGFSISDLVYLEFQELAKSGPGKTFHFNDIYNRVFFRRMCSPGGVWSILKRHPSYYKYIGEKIWEFVGTINGDEIWARSEPKKKNNKIFIYIILILAFLILFFKLISIKM